jgi:ATP-dependent Lhr-like helicase
VLAWQGVSGGRRRAATEDLVMEVVEQLAGVPIPASALEKQVLSARISGYSSAHLDALGSSGEIVWCGCGPLGPSDGWVAIAPTDRAALVLPEPVEEGLSEEAKAIREALGAGGALFFRQLCDAVGSDDDNATLHALWELVWAGWATNDTFAALRSLTGGGRRRADRRGRARRPPLPSRAGPPSATGRWSLLPARENDATKRLHALAEQLLGRYGIVTRGCVTPERVPGGFSAIYPVLKAMEESGRCRRGYFVEGLGGAQFALPGAVDRLRAPAGGDGDDTRLLAATDPANPYGAALPWPEREGGGHRAGRKVGAVCVLVRGMLVLYVEKGGRTVLSYSDDAEILRPAVDALALAVREGKLGRLALERADGATVFDTPVARALVEAGFRLTSRGLLLRA